MAHSGNGTELSTDQYRDDTNLRARIDLHAQYSTNPYGWSRWVFDEFDLPERCRVLELGCGSGGLWADNRHRIPDGWRITLSDSSPGMLAATRETLSGVGRPFAFEVIDAESIPMADGSFDAVIANHMLYHVPDLDRALGEIRRVLVPGGVLHATTNGPAHLAEIRDLVRPITPDLLFVRNTNIRAFSLANGGAALGRFFTDVRVDRYDDALAIPDVDPLLGFIMSTIGAAGALSPVEISELRRRIEQRIAADGVFRVTKRPGMFVATKAL